MKALSTRKSRYLVVNQLVIRDTVIPRLKANVSVRFTTLSGICQTKYRVCLSPIFGELKRSNGDRSAAIEPEVSVFYLVLILSECVLHHIGKDGIIFFVDVRSHAISSVQFSDDLIGQVFLRFVFECVHLMHHSILVTTTSDEIDVEREPRGTHACPM